MAWVFEVCVTFIFSEVRSDVLPTSMKLLGLFVSNILQRCERDVLGLGVFTWTSSLRSWLQKCGLLGINRVGG
jgi:hypothetical protein